jgi:hypothetical protein
MEQIQMMERESLDLFPEEFVEMKLDKISSSPTNPLNQCMRVELKWSAMFHGVVVDPVDQLRFLNDSSQTVVVRVANVGRCFRQTKLQSFVHRDEDVFVLVLLLTPNLGDLQRNLDQDGKRRQDVLAGVVEGELFPVLTYLEGVELGCPLDPDLAFLGNVNPYVTGLVLVSFSIVASNILRTELNAGLNGGRTDESDQRLNVDDSPEIQKSVPFEMGEIVFGSRLKLDIPEIGATISESWKTRTCPSGLPNTIGICPGLPLLGSTL